MSELRYRPDVDGLRAIAVLSVVLFHAGVQSISGGFSGVDVFFVISGFLITSIIAKEIRRGDFSIVTFYERRIRRILPAFFVVTAFSSIIAFILLMPKEFEGYGKSLIAAALSISNILFYSESGYFDSSAEVKPLLHTWSLGVEEQFYIFFPIFLLAISRFSKQRWVVWMLPLAIASFLASVWGAEHQPSATFYLAPTRAWELAMGAILALGAIPVVHHRFLREIVAFAGTGLIVWGDVALTSESAFPGINALLPCVGAALIIHAGTSGQSLVGHLLGWRPLVLIGLISYSLYLWHWPLLVFAKYYAVRPLTNIETIVVLLTALIAAIASWHFVERPFRKRKMIISRPSVFVGGSILTVVAVAFGLVVVLSKGWPSRMPDDALKLANGASDISASSMACMEKNRTMKEGGELCYIGAEKGTPSFIVLGDSHAGALMPGVDLAAKKWGAKGIHAAMHSCPPLDGVINRKDEIGQRCMKFRNEMLALIEGSPAIQNVVLIARWAAFAEGTRYGKDDIGPKPLLIDELHQSTGNHNVFAAGLERTVERLRRANKQVYIVFSVPEVGWNVPRVSARNVFVSNDMDIRPKMRDFSNRNIYVSEIIDRLVSKQGVKVIKPEFVLCTSGYCSITINGKSLYYDDNHLSVFGAEFISGLFDPIFQNTK